MRRLAEQVDSALASVGFPRERRGFAAHATLGRVRSPRNATDLLAAIRAEEREAFGAVVVADFALMQSQLNPQGSIYTVLDRFILGGTAAEGRR